MTPRQVADRIILSRRTFAALAGAFGAGDIAPEAFAGYRRQITAEVVILRQLAVEHPARAATLARLIDKYEALAQQMGRVN